MKSLTKIRMFVLGDGLPPNDGKCLGYFIVEEYPDGHVEFDICFNNSASEIWISQKETKAHKSGVSNEEWTFHCNDTIFRKMALWYLWRWAWGEWFGLRRWLYYKWLHWYMGKKREKDGRQEITGC